MSFSKKDENENVPQSVFCGTFWLFYCYFVSEIT